MKSSHLASYLDEGPIFLALALSHFVLFSFEMKHSLFCAKVSPLHFGALALSPLFLFYFETKHSLFCAKVIPLHFGVFILSLKNKELGASEWGSICKPFTAHKSCVKRSSNIKLTLLDILTCQFNNCGMSDEIFHLHPVLWVL
jgi:hypothetical protein